MKYWHIFYNASEGKYKMRASDSPVSLNTELATFKEFQMAYQYVCRMNGDAMQISRWARQ